MIYKLQHTFTQEDGSPYSNYRVDILEAGTNVPVRIYAVNGNLLSSAGISSTDSQGVVTAYVPEEKPYTAVLRHPDYREEIQRTIILNVGSGTDLSYGPTGPTGPVGPVGPSITGPAGPTGPAGSGGGGGSSLDPFLLIGA